MCTCIFIKVESGLSEQNLLIIDTLINITRVNKLEWCSLFEKKKEFHVINQRLCILTEEILLENFTKVSKENFLLSNVT